MKKKSKFPDHSGDGKITKKDILMAKGTHKTKDGRTAKKGLWYNIHMKKKRGTKGKCTPITKKGCTGRAKALAKTFKKMAKKRKS